MPGSFVSVFLVAFDLDDHGHPMRAFAPRLAANEGAAIEEARDIARAHVGVVVWKREANMALGEEGDPVILFQSGKVGDFG